MSKLAEIDIEDLKEELMQCRRCGICRNAVYEAKGFDGICPVWKSSDGFETSFMRGKVQVALALIDGVLEKTPENAESLFKCTLCGNCTQICAAEFDPAHSLEQVREYLNEIPNLTHDALAEKITKHNNPYDEDNTLKRKWVEELGFDIPGNSDTLYYVGCTAGMKLPDDAVRTAKILKAADVEFTVLEDEPCCGSVMIRTGRMDKATSNAERLMESIRKSGASRIVVSCAGCLKTLREDYPTRFGVEMPEVIHIVELADELIQRGELKPKPIGEGIRVAYHDPCHIGRELGIYNEPRNILTAIPGIDLVEFPTNRDQAMCCGAGGGLRSYDSGLAKKIGADRVKSAEKVDADLIATACPFCELNLRSGAETESIDMDTVDVVELLARSIE